MGREMSHQILLGDCRERLKELPDNSIDSIVTDPPYELGFMGKSWDASGVAYDVTVWQECLRVLKPGGHLLSFGGSRTYHRMACAIEDAGFQIRDQIMWVYGSGFPKSLNISKAIDKAAGAEREVVGELGYTNQDIRGGGYESDKAKTKDRLPAFITAPATAEAKEWDGWGTALKPAHEPIVLARKPLVGTVANNVLTHGVGGLNIDGCRVGTDDILNVGSNNRTNALINFGMADAKEAQQQNPMGRFPANFIHDGSDEVLELFPDTKGGTWNTTKGARHFNNDGEPTGYATSKSDGSTGSAARFFYCAKASKKDRNEGLDPDLFPLQNYTDANKMGGAGDTMLTGSGNPRDGRKHNHHPTVKPTELMRYLCRLITPPNGTVLDPFTGSGSTGKAAVIEGFSFIGVEQSEEYIAIAEARIQSAKEDK
jgi:site-specific DNA-methyltransferase (adenine-specific)